jgi:hypothetical protein
MFGEDKRIKMEDAATNSQCQEEITRKREEKKVQGEQG